MLTTRLIPILAALSLVTACAQPAPYTDVPPDGTGTGSGAGFGSVTSSVFGPGVPETILFVVDTSTLTDEAKTILTAQAAYFNQNPQTTAVIEGHADERGTREYNLALGAQRASAARDFLVLNGVADSRLSTVTFGKERPLEICADEACYARNRRAVTVVEQPLVVGM